MCVYVWRVWGGVGSIDHDQTINYVLFARGRGKQLIYTCMCSAKLLRHCEFEFMTAVNQADSSANTPRMLSHRGQRKLSGRILRNTVLLQFYKLRSYMIYICTVQPSKPNIVRFLYPQCILYDVSLAGV